MAHKVIQVRAADLRVVSSTEIRIQTNYNSYSRWGPVGSGTNADASSLAGGTARYLVSGRMRGGVTNSAGWDLRFASTSVTTPSEPDGHDLSTAWENNQFGIIYSSPRISTDLVVPSPNFSGNRLRDASEFYSWRTPESVQRLADTWIAALVALAANQRDFTITLWDGQGTDPRTVAPSFDDATGDALTTQVGSSETVTVPQANGNPAPTYAVVGTLPNGVTFDTATRVLTVAPTAVASGTITIRATNTGGTADWTVSYSFAAPTPAAPSFATSSGTAISAKVGESITDTTVPEASGFPVPTYAAVGTLPAGIQFNASTRVLSGTPTEEASGTITIRATNTQGSADWTVAYTFLGPLALSDLVAPAGRMLTTAALLTRTTADPNWYQTAVRGGSDTPLAGDLVLEAGYGPITRIYLDATQRQLRFNDNSSNPDQGVYWASGGLGHDLQLHVLNDERVVETLVIADLTIQSSGNNFTNFVVPQSFVDHMNTIAVNERWAIGFSRMGPAEPLDVTFGVTSGPTGTVPGIAVSVRAAPDPAAATLAVTSGPTGSVPGVSVSVLAALEPASVTLATISGPTGAVPGVAVSVFVALDPAPVTLGVTEGPTGAVPGIAVSVREGPDPLPAPTADMITQTSMRWIWTDPDG